MKLMIKRLSKNVSQTIRNGTVIKTRDEFLEDNNGYIKPSHRNDKVLYREFITLETNKKGEIVGVKIQSGGNPIRLGENFKRVKNKYWISEKDANRIKKDAINHPNRKIRKQNREKLRELKGRKKRK